MHKLHHAHSATSCPARAVLVRRIGIMPGLSFPSFIDWMLILAAALLVGCKDREAELAEAAKAAAAAATIERDKPQGLVQFERIRHVAELVRDRAPLAADSRSLPFEKASFKKYADPPPDGAFGGAEMLYEEGMRTDSFAGRITVDDRPFWGRCGAWFATGKNPDGSPPEPQYPRTSIEEELQAFLKVKYLGVARTVEERLPEAVNDDEFKAGRYRFDMFFYELADPPKYLGGLRVDARNEANVQFKYRQGSRQAYMEERLRFNLDYQTQSALYKLMTERAKGITMKEPKDYGL